MCFVISWMTSLPFILMIFWFLSSSIEEHEAHLDWVFNQLRKHSLKAKIKKCCFGV